MPNDVLESRCLTARFNYFFHCCNRHRQLWCNYYLISPDDVAVRTHEPSCHHTIGTTKLPVNRKKTKFHLNSTTILYSYIIHSEKLCPWISYFPIYHAIYLENFWAAVESMVTDRIFLLLQWKKEKILWVMSQGSSLVPAVYSCKVVTYEESSLLALKKQ